MDFARISVKDVDLQAYKDFHASQQKAKQKAGDLPGERLQWPDNTSIIDEAKQDDIYGNSKMEEDDLYGASSNAQPNPDEDDLYST